MRLPCYQPNDRKRVVSDRAVSRADAGLPEEATVYCCFNGLHKLTAFVFRPVDGDPRARAGQRAVAAEHG